MAPLGLFAPIKASKFKDRRGRKSADKKGTKVEKQSQKTTRKKDFEFWRLPAEIQHKIWAEVMSKPSCHTFKLARSRGGHVWDRWDVDVKALPERYDPSAYRLWKSLLHCKPAGKAKGDANGNDKLKCISFQAGFRHAMLDFRRVCLKTSGINGAYREAAAINVATDLVIIEFERGATSPAFSWFEHSTTHMALHVIRDRMRHFKRVAIHYKPAHAGADKHGPFHCYCLPPITLGCHKYKACCFELACFLDCFKDLEEFYFVVEPQLRDGRDWADLYKEKVREQRYQVAEPAQKGGNAFKLSHFFDTKNEYIQHCPPRFLRGLSKGLASSPFSRPQGPRECLVKTKHIYNGTAEDEKFANSLEKRKQVKFGLLIRYTREAAQTENGGEQPS